MAPPVPGLYTQILDAGVPLGYCYPELDFNSGSKAPFGHNWTHPDAPMDHPFTHWTAEELGSNPGGQKSAAIASLMREPYETAGFVALLIPFFSEEYIPPENGTVQELTNFREWYVTPTNPNRPRWFCVRYSHNGRDFRQLCDPTEQPVDGWGGMTGVVRAAAEEWWNDLKRAHWIDSLTRSVSVTMQLKSNHMGVRYRLSLLLETTSLGAVLPSFDVETRILSYQREADMAWYAQLSLYMCLMFAVLEGIEIFRSIVNHGLKGVGDYLTDVWNWMDWLNFGCFALAYWQVQLAILSAANREHSCATAYLCRDAGYFDDWQAMMEYRTAKQFLSINLSLQLLKINKFTSALVPKMSIFVDVLRLCLVDMVFFSISIILTVASFSMMLYVQLGPIVNDFYEQVPSAIGLARGLFSDFDISEVMHNSSGYYNAALYLLYLFVAVFIILSLFLSLLAEGFVKVKTEREKEKADDPHYSEFGLLYSGWRSIVWGIKKTVEIYGGNAGVSALAFLVIGEDGVDDSQLEGNAAWRQKNEKLAREARERDRIVEAYKEIRSLSDAVEELSAAIVDLRGAPPQQEAPEGGGNEEGSRGEGLADETASPVAGGPGLLGVLAKAKAADEGPKKRRRRRGLYSMPEVDPTIDIFTGKKKRPKFLVDRWGRRLWLEPLERSVQSAVTGADSRVAEQEAAQEAAQKAQAEDAKATAAEMAEVTELVKDLDAKLDGYLDDMDRRLAAAESGKPYESLDEAERELMLERAMEERLAEREGRLAAKKHAEEAANNPDGAENLAPLVVGKDGRVLDGSGRLFGIANAKGQVVDAQGNLVGVTSEDGKTVIDVEGQIVRSPVKSGARSMDQRFRSFTSWEEAERQWQQAHAQGAGEFLGGGGSLLTDPTRATLRLARRGGGRRPPPGSRPWTLGAWTPEREELAMQRAARRIGRAPLSRVRPAPFTEVPPMPPRPPRPPPGSSAQEESPGEETWSFPAARAWSPPRAVPINQARAPLPGSPQVTSNSIGSPMRPTPPPVMTSAAALQVKAVEWEFAAAQRELEAAAQEELLAAQGGA